MQLKEFESLLADCEDLAKKEPDAKWYVDYSIDNPGGGFLILNEKNELFPAETLEDYRGGVAVNKDDLGASYFVYSFTTGKELVETIQELAGVVRGEYLKLAGSVQEILEKDIVRLRDDLEEHFKE